MFKDNDEPPSGMFNPKESCLPVGFPVVSTNGRWTLLFRSERGRKRVSFVPTIRGLLHR